MRENFNKAFELLMELEGYESNDPDDKGGPTKWGISSVYNPHVNLETLTKDEAKEIYLYRYWVTCDCDNLDYPLDVVLFIQGVNLGVSRAKKFMEEGNGLLDFFMKNFKHYATRPKVQRDVFLTGWCSRLIKLWEAI